MVLPALCAAMGTPTGMPVPAAAAAARGVPAADLAAGAGDLVPPDVLKGVQLDDCVKLLGGATDEEKFAGLLLVTKVAQPEDCGAMRRVLGAVGMRFLFRLLASPAGAGAAGDTALMYQCMALNVLSSFCSLHELWPEVHAQTDFVRMAPLLLKTLEGAQGVMHPAIDSALVCLACLSASDAGTRALCQHGGPAAVASFMQAQRDEEPERKSRALFVLDSLLTPAHNPVATAEAVPKMAQVLADGNGVIRLDLLPRMERTLRSQEPAFVARLHALGLHWHGTVRGALMNLFQNKLPTQYRKHILGVALGMCEHFGQRWALCPTAPDAQCANGTFVQLLVGSTNIELRMRLEEASKPADNAEVVPVALALVEKTLEFLSEGGEAEGEDGSAGVLTKTAELQRWTDMDVERLLKMKRDLDEAVDAVFIYLEDLHDAGTLDDALVLPMCRLLGLWFLEVDSDEFTQKLCAALPVICRTAHAHAGAPQTHETVPLFFMLPALSQLVSDEDVLRSLLLVQGHVVVAEMLATALRDGRGGGATDACLAGAVLLTRVLALRPRASDKASETFRELVAQLLPVAVAMSQVARRRDTDAETAESALEHVATVVSLAFQVWQARPADAWQQKRDAPVLQEYASVLRDTVQQWVAWDAGALCLLAAASAAAAHESIRALLLAAGVDAALAGCGEGCVSGLNREALVSLSEILRHGSSSQAHAEALERAAQADTGEDEEEARKRDAAIRAATRRPDAPPHIGKFYFAALDQSSRP